MENLVRMITEMGIPFAYDHFAEGESPNPPFICYILPNDDDSLSADGGIYFRVARVRIELYTDFKDLENEKKVTSVLDGNGISYKRNEAWIADERLYEETFEFDMPMKEESENEQQ